MVRSVTGCAKHSPRHLVPRLNATLDAGETGKGKNIMGRRPRASQKAPTMGRALTRRAQPSRNGDLTRPHTARNTPSPWAPHPVTRQLKLAFVGNWLGAWRLDMIADRQDSHGITATATEPAGSLRSPHLTRRCSRRVTLAFPPYRCMVDSQGLGKGGRASAPRG